MRKSLVATLIIGIAVGAAGHALVSAQSGSAPLQLPPGIKNTPLLRTDLTGVEGKEIIMGVLEVAPGASVPRHIHHGQELVYVLEGTGATDVQGQPTQTVKAGDHLHRPFHVPHDFRNPGTTPVKVVSVFIVDKGKPLIVPMP